MFSDSGLSEEDRISCLQIPATIVHSFQILLDHSSAVIKAPSSFILQERQRVSTDEDFC